MPETLLHPEQPLPSYITVVHTKDQTQESRKRSLIRNIAKILLNINLKTIRFNFRYFSFRDAIKFPVFVKSNAHLVQMKGSLRIEGEIYPGMIRIGSSKVGHFDKKFTRCIWDVEGDVVFKGIALLKFGSKIVVAKGAYLEIGNKFRISPDSSIICYKKIIIGDSCRISWEVQIMDTDFHKIKALTGELLNPAKEILIGNHVWIGTRVSIMKGTSIYDDCIVATGSVVTKAINGNHQIIAGIPAKVVKTDVTWEE